MCDPLTLLRTYHIGRKEIIEIDGHFVFGEIAYLKEIKTNYLKCRSSKDEAPKDYYTLECLLFFIKHKYPTYSDYMHHARAQDIPVVHRRDRKNLLDYLFGLKSVSFSIDMTAPVPIPTRAIRVDDDELEEMEFDDADFDLLIISDTQDMIIHKEIVSYEFEVEAETIQFKPEYCRYRQEKFLGFEELKVFNIDPTKSFLFLKSVSVELV